MLIVYTLTPGYPRYVVALFPESEIDKARELCKDPRYDLRRHDWTSGILPFRCETEVVAPEIEPEKEKSQ
jgi:hypothetical protein